MNWYYFLAIYFSGYLVLYFVTKNHDSQKLNRNEWSHVQERAIFSILSWFGLFVVCLAYVSTKMARIILTVLDKSKFPKNPPKWL